MSHSDNTVIAQQLLPFSVDVITSAQELPSWFTEIRLYFVLSGSARVITGSSSFSVQTEDVFLTNAGDVHQIIGSDWQLLALSFSPDTIAKTLAGQILRFELCSSGSTYAPGYDYIRYCLAQLASTRVGKEPYFSALSIFYALCSHLITNFPSSASLDADSSRNENRERMHQIAQYIHNHFRENLTLSKTAKDFGLTSPYLSAFFKKQTGMTFSDFYNNIRLNYAVRDLLFSSESIETIAQRNGFSDPRSFTALFRKKYDSLPAAYRKSIREKDPNIRSGQNASDQNSIFLNIHAYPSLSKYLTVFREETEYFNILTERPRIIDGGTICFPAHGKQLSHNYHNMICVGNAKQFLYSEIQEMLRRTQREIHFQYVKFHGLLSDDMMVYSEDANGNPHYSFLFIDKVLDFMLSIGLKPLCQLSFMPIALAEDPSRLVDFYHYNTSPPKDMNKWTGLVHAVVQHLIARYGLEEVKTWPFCVWNEPDETVEQFAWDDRNRFFDFYRRTWQTVKEICPDLQFGTPSLLISVQKEQGWAGDFFQYTVRNHCPPDFLNIHYYDNSLFEEDTADRVRSEKGYSAENMEHSFPLTVDPHAFNKFITTLKALMRRHNMRQIPIYLTEWNLTISHRDLINDTCFKSCHLVKNLLENYDRLQSFSYWCLTDFEEELQLPDKLYHGGLGLFTYNGIPKANYNAFRLLGRLGNELLARGDGYFVTQTDNGISILLYNYEHYSRLFASGYRAEFSDTNRYQAFEDMSTAQFLLRLTNLPYTTALVKERYVNQAAGSSYDAWARMGSLSVTSADDLEILQQQSQPGLSLHRETIKDGNLTLHARMAPLEIRLLEVEFSRT